MKTFSRSEQKNDVQNRRTKKKSEKKKLLEAEKDKKGLNKTKNGHHF